MILAPTNTNPRDRILNHLWPHRIPHIRIYLDTWICVWNPWYISIIEYLKSTSNPWFPHYGWNKTAFSPWTTWLFDAAQFSIYIEGLNHCRPRHGITDYGGYGWKFWYVNSNYLHQLTSINHHLPYWIGNSCPKIEQTPYCWCYNHLLVIIFPQSPHE